MTEPKDPFKILGVPHGADKAQIRSAYLQLARKYHPDMHPPGDTYAEEMFKEVAAAYQVLSDDALRARYEDGPDYTFNSRKRQASPPQVRVPPTPQPYPMTVKRQLSPVWVRGCVAVYLLVTLVFATFSHEGMGTGYVLWVLIPGLLILVGVVSGHVTSKVAEKRGRDSTTWFAIGAVTFFVAAIVLYRSEPARRPNVGPDHQAYQKRNTSAK